MATSYASLLDQIPAPLPLTDRSAQYLRTTVQQLDTEIARLTEAEARYREEADAAKAVRKLLEDSRETYVRGLGDHAAPVVEPPVWPVQPEERGNSAEPCPKCARPMYLTAKYGFVHEINDMWHAAGQWCVEPPLDGESTS